MKGCLGSKMGDSVEEKGSPLTKVMTHQHYSVKWICISAGRAAVRAWAYNLSFDVEVRF